MIERSEDMKITFAGVYTPKEVTFDNVKKFSIVVVRRGSRIVDVDVEVDGTRHSGCERITIEEEGLTGMESRIVRS